MATATTATPAYAAPLRKGGSNLRPESVISFLTRNEQGDRCLYRVSDHLPTPDEVRQWHYIYSFTKQKK